MKIQVTKEHIEKGREQSCRRCPIALALAEQLNCGVMVNNSHVEIYKSRSVIPSELKELVLLPKTARRFVARFDNGVSVKPFEFEFEIEGL